MTKKKKLEIVKYNKKIQNRINLSVNDYKEYSETFTQIKIEIIPTKNKYEIDEEDKIKKVKIIINYQVKSFKKLFFECECIESINFKIFYKNNKTNN